jgi:hypothetical protein
MSNIKDSAPTIVYMSREGSVQQDYGDQFFDTLPEEAKKYFVRAQKKLSLDQILNHMSGLENAYIGAVSLLCCFPLLRVRYVSANEIIRIVRHGIHELYKGPGYFTSEGLMDQVLEPVPIGSDIIFGPIKLIYVQPGTLKYGLDFARAKPMLLEPGLHYFDDININIDRREVHLNSRENALIPIADGNSFNFIFVKTGSNGVINKADGTLKVIEPGIHFIEAPDTFKTFVSVQQEFIKISNTVDNKFLTADNIELDIQATLFYKISNVEKAFTRSIKDNDDLYSTLLSQARALLTTLIRSEYFSNVGKANMTQSVKENLKEFYQKDSVGSDTSHEVQSMPTANAVALPPTAPPIPNAPVVTPVDASSGFQSMVKDIEPQFMEKMREYGDQFGFEVQSLRIENMHYADKAMQEKISQMSLKYAELAQQEATLAVERKVELAQAEREKQQLMIKVQGEADRKMIMFENERSISMSKNKLENDILLEQVRAKAEASTLQVENEAKTKAIKADADNKILLEQVRTKTTASKMEAEVDAKNKLVKADAEAEYIRKIGEAQYLVDQKNSSLPFAEVRIVTTAQKEALTGVQKVVYTNDQNLLLKPYMNLMEKDLTK